MSKSGPITLRKRTSAKWLPLALRHFDQVLVDHAHCEKKAAAHALSMLVAYPDVPGLPLAMARLAREESSHLAAVIQKMNGRGLSLGKDAGDPYAQKLLQLVRKGQPETRLDKLLISGLIESRSCERLALLADGLTEPSLARFYRDLATSEDGHQELFFRLAVKANGEAAALKRLDELLDAEADILSSLPIEPRIH